MRKLYPQAIAFFFSTLFFLNLNAQTTLINPAGDGGFETGADFTSNGWTVVNASTNKWFCGTVTSGTNNTSWFTGSRGAYISNNATGTTWNYSTSSPTASHFYRDITFPAGETTITLTFNWRGNGNDALYDILQVYLVPTTSTPTTSSPTGTSKAPTWLSGGYFLLEKEGTATPTTTTTLSYTFTADQANYAAGSTQRLVFTWKSDDLFGANPPAAVDNISLVSSCSSPASGLASNSVTHNSADLNWSAASGATGYLVRYKKISEPASVASWATPVSTATNSLSLTGLSQASQYEFQVSAIGVSCTVFTPSATFTTTCAAEAIPTAVQSFDATTIPICWSRSLITGTANWAPDTDNDGVPASHTGARFMGKDYTASDALIISQPVNMTTAGANGARINVWIYRNTLNKATDRIRFHINTTADISGATQILEIFPKVTETPSVATAGWYNYTADIPASFNTETIVYFIAQGTTDGTLASYGIGFDNFKVETIPSCNEPTDILISGIGTSTAQVDWTSPTSGSPTGYQLYYSTNNTAPTSGTIPTATVGNVASTNLTGLTSSATYYLWVRSACGGTDVSAWTATPVTFTTLCVSVTGFTENFDGVTTPALPVCWKKVSTTGLSSTQNTSSNSTPNCLYIYGGSNTDVSVVSMPPVSNLAAGTHRLKFKARANFTAGGIIEVGYLTDPNDAATFTMLQSFTISALTYNDYEAIPSSVSGSDVLAFRHTGVPAYSVLIDDVKWEVIPSCNEPTDIIISNIGTTTAQVDWTAPIVGSPSSYQVYYNTSNTAPTAGTSPTVTGISGPSTNLSALTPATTYYLWVRSFCGGSDVSAWSNIKTFVTLCTPVTSFTQSFDGVTAPALPVCWGKVGTTGAVNTQTANNSSSPNCLYIYSSSASNIAMVSLPPVSNMDAGTHRLRFKARGSGTANGIIEVGYLTDPLDASTFNQIQSVTITTLTYQDYNVVVSPVTGQQVMALRHTGSPANAVLIDDVKWEAIPSCNEPTAIIISTVTATTAQVDWTAPAAGSVTDYTWEVRTSGAAGSGASGLVSSGSTAATTVNLAALNPGSLHTFYIRTNCISPDVSAYTSKSIITLPANDDCSNAVVLVNGTSVNGSTVGATQTMPGVLCDGFTGTADDDVWYQFMASYNGDVTIATTNATLDVVIIAYSGLCGSLTSIGCADAALSVGNETLNLSGLTAGETYYFRIYSWNSGAANQGTYSVTITGNALPVTLTNFRGERSGSINKLYWNTSTELNNAGFELQRSADGINFSKLTYVASKATNGNSTSALSYNFDDVKPLIGNGYYRLKQIDKDGKANYSNTVLIKGAKVSTLTISSLYPNPAKNEVNVVFSSPAAERISVVVTDLTGKVIMQRSTQVVIGDNKLQLNVSALAQGSYFIKAVCSNGCESAVHKFIKQ